MEGVNKQGPKSPLLPVSRVKERSDKENWNDVLAEVKGLLILAVPLVTVNLLVFSLQLISLMFVGHLGKLHLSGASLATSFASVTGFSLLTGMAGALETFCGQAYGGKQYHMLGIYMQRAMFILLLVSIPLACVSANTRDILAFFGQDREISIEAGQYAQYLIPSIFAIALLQCQIRFLQAQKTVLPMMLIAGITALLHVFTSWLLVFKSGLGSKGAALANSISYWINVSLLSVYIKISYSCKNTWTGFSSEAFHDIWNFLRLGIPSSIMACLEMWSFELMVLLSGLLPNPKLETSVLSICLNTCSLIFMLPLGLSGAVSTRVSNEVGAQRPHEARIASLTGLLVTVIEGILVSTTIILGRKFWGYFYSKDEEVVRYVAEMLVLLAGSHILEGIQSVLSGIARGSGWQKIGAVINLGAYYLLGIPAAILLAFFCHLGGKGLWMGIILALFAQASLLAIVTVQTDWDKEAKKASDRVYESAMFPTEAS